MPRRAHLALAVGACLALCGCGNKIAIDPPPVAKYRIAVIPKGLTHEFWQNIERGARRASADLADQRIPVQILWDGPSKESDANEQINLIQQMAHRGIHGLVLAPQHRTQMVPPVEEVVGAGIPVVIIDSGLDPEAQQR